MTDIDYYHKQWHQILGRLTTIRSACSVLVEDYQDKLPPDVYEMLKTMNDQATQMVAELNELKEKMYGEIENKPNYG